MIKPTLTYFASRGRAELIRLVCAEAGIDWSEQEVAREHLRTDKLRFGAVPLWEEPDGFKLAQSLAIVGYLATTHGLAGKTPREAAQVNQTLGAYDDVRTEMRKLAVVEADQRAAVRQGLASEFLPRWLGYLDRVLASNRDGQGFVVGDSLTVADLALWYLLELIVDNGFTALETYPRLIAYAERIGKRPRLAEYLRSAKRFPFAPLPR